MKSKIAAVILNSGLLVLVVTLLSAPLLMGQLLGEFESGALGASTTGTPVSPLATTATAGGIAVYPNITDFTQYAAFDENPIVDDKTYQTSVTFTAFAGQQAAYNALFTMYNTSRSAITVSVEGGKLSSSLPGSQIWLSLVPDGGIASTLITEAAKEGSSVLRVAQTAGFKAGNVVVGEQVAAVESVTPSTLKLKSPLKSAVSVGQHVYYGPAYYNKSATAALNTTHTIQLQPQQKATINLAVATSPGDTATSQSVLPLIIHTQ